TVLCIKFSPAWGALFLDCGSLLPLLVRRLAAALRGFSVCAPASWLIQSGDKSPHSKTKAPAGLSSCERRFFADFSAPPSLVSLFKGSQRSSAAILLSPIVG